MGLAALLEAEPDLVEDLPGRFDGLFAEDVLAIELGHLGTFSASASTCVR